ncbi:MAG TPA: hypothetical protein VGL94_23445 [Ktedonobacteraceae bacterium]
MLTHDPLVQRSRIFFDQRSTVPLQTIPQTQQYQSALQAAQNRCGAFSAINHYMLADIATGTL